MKAPPAKTWLRQMRTQKNMKNERERTCTKGVGYGTNWGRSVGLEIPYRCPCSFAVRQEKRIAICAVVHQHQGRRDGDELDRNDARGTALHERPFYGTLRTDPSEDQDEREQVSHGRIRPVERGAAAFKYAKKSGLRYQQWEESVFSRSM